jgi:hypothetical protein
MDVRKFSKWGQDLYVRVSPSELGAQLFIFLHSKLLGILSKDAVYLSDQNEAIGHKNKNKIIGITFGVVIFGLITFLSILLTIKNPGIYTCII